MSNALAKASLNIVEVEKLLAMRETQKALKDRLAAIDEAIDQSESAIIELVEMGCDTSQCGYEVLISEVARRFPAWKEHFISKLGKEEAERVTDATPAKIYKRLILKG